jgi:cell division protein FtsB
LGPLLHSFFQRASRRFGLVAAIAAVTAYGLVFFFGPQGVQALIAKRDEIRQLQEQNAVLARENEARKERIRRLAESHSEQEMEIRKQLKLLRPGETTFILPDPPKDSGAK